MLVIALSMLSACESGVAPTRPDESSVRLSTPSAGMSIVRPSRTIDDEFEDLAARIPGFGGAYVDSLGRLTINLARPEDYSLARAELATMLDRSTGGLFTVFERAGIRVRVARFDYRDLRRWYRTFVTRDLLSQPGAVFGDIDERENRILVGVNSEAVASRMRARVAAFHLPAHAIEIVVEAATAPKPLTFLNDCDPTIAITDCPPDSPTGGGGWTGPLLTESVRPAIAGVQIAYQVGTTPFLCSLSYNVTRTAGGALDPARYFITASHCGDIQGQVTGIAMGQPSVVSTIAHEQADPGFIDQSTDPRCTAGRQCRYADAALFRYDLASTSGGATVAFPALGTSTVSSTRQVSQLSSSTFLGMVVHMVGRTSGHQQGAVTWTCRDLAVATPTGQDSGKTMLCQDQANYVSAGGDSGAPVFSILPDGSVAAIGVHWGNNAQGSAYSRIANVLGEIGQASGATIGATW